MLAAVLRSLRFDWYCARLPGRVGVPQGLKPGVHRDSHGAAEVRA